MTVNSQNYLNRSAIGYMVNTLVGETAANEIKKIQAAFESEFGNNIWATPSDALHVTLLDWLAPLADYGNDKDRLFEEIFPKYDKALSEILDKVNPVDLNFSRLVVSSSAVAIVADEECTKILNDVRQKFLDKIELLPSTKQPPNIVHSTIIRFVGEAAVASVKNFASTLDFSFNNTISEFQLVRETSLPMLKYSAVKKYPLAVTLS